MKPCSESSVQNRQPILEVLRKEFGTAQRVLEVGSGTGQHAVFFAAELPHLLWQPSDLPEMLPGIQAWIDDAGCANVMPPLALDVNDPWPESHFDAVFSANAVHIMSWTAVEAMFAGIGRVLEPGGVLALYGPFNYGGRYTSESNARFDQWLRHRDPQSGIRDFDAINALARSHGLQFHHDHAMPVNNRTLVWRRSND